MRHVYVFGMHVRACAKYVSVFLKWLWTAWSSCLYGFFFLPQFTALFFSSGLLFVLLRFNKATLNPDPWFEIFSVCFCTVEGWFLSPIVDNSLRMWAFLITVCLFWCHALMCFPFREEWGIRDGEEKSSLAALGAKYLSFPLDYNSSKRIFFYTMGAKTSG